MANYTQSLIIDTFNSMLERMAFDKITVTSLIKECKIGRNTFYYHYSDIYALLDQALTQWLSSYLESESYESWQDIAKSILHSCKDNKRKIYNVYNSLSRDQICFYVFGKISETIALYIEEYVEMLDGDLDRAKLVSEMITYTICGLFMRFLWNDMQDDIDEGVDKLALVFDELLEGLTS